MPAVSKAQQKFFGIVRAIQKGEMAPTTPETAKAAADMKKSDVKKFASTKHKGLPDKKEVEEAYYGGEQQRKKDQKKVAYEKQLKRMLPKRAFDQMGREIDPRSGKLKEEKNYDQRNKILKRAKPLHKHLYKNLHKGDRTGDVNEKIDLTDRKQMRRIADAEKRHKEQDKRMKFGKFYAKAKEARDRLRPGEVKKWDKEKGRYVSNKE